MEGCWSRPDDVSPGADDGGVEIEQIDRGASDDVGSGHFDNGGGGIGGSVGASNIELKDCTSEELAETGGSNCA